MIDLICIGIKTEDGRFLIPESQDGREIVNELLKNPELLLCNAELWGDRIYDFQAEASKLLNKDKNHGR